MKNILVVTGGAGFIGSNLIQELIKFKKYKIISLDNYSAGSLNNHIKKSKVKYLKGNTQNIESLLKVYKKGCSFKSNLFYFIPNEDQHPKRIHLNFTWISFSFLCIH